MNIPTLPHWGQFAGLVILETLLILLFAAGVAGLCRSAMWKRAIWQVALVAGLLVLLCEGAGVTRMAAGWMAAVRPAESAVREVVVTRGEPPVWGDTPTRSGAGGPAGLTVPIENAGPAGSWWPGFVWMGGLIFWMIWFARGRWFCWRMARRQPEHSSAVLREEIRLLASRMNLRRRVRLLESRRLRGPVVLGLWRPVVILPSSFEGDYDRVQQRAMLAHELAHLAARDPFWHGLADLTAAVAWWNPLVWWMRRNLRVTSEFAADEASLLVENGHEKLAESLVQLGRKLTGNEAAMPLAMAGYRSALGRRVERLFELEGHSWRPGNRGLQWVARAMGPCLLAALVSGAGFWAHAAGDDGKGGWRSSLAGMALLATAGPGEAGDPETVDEDSPEAAVAADSNHKELIARTYAFDPWLLELNLERLPHPGPDAISPAELSRDPLEPDVPSPVSKPRVAAPSTRLTRWLQSRGAEMDTPGATLFISTSRGQVYVRTTPAGMEAVQKAFLELKKAPPGAQPWRSNEIEPEPELDSVEKLYTRTYKLDVRTVEMGLTQWSGEPVTSDNVGEAVKRFVRETALLPWMKASAVGFNEDAGRLFVRASLAELEMVDAALRVLNDAPQQILVEAILAEITSKPGEGIGLHDLLDVNSRVAPTVHEIDDPAGAARNGTATDAIGDSDQPVISGAWSMTPEQLGELRVRLEDARADVLTPMKVTTLSGRQTQIKIVDLKSIVTGAQTNPDGTVEFVTETVEIGPVVDVVPMASADRTGIRLTATATMKEFLGYLAAPVDGLTPEGVGEPTPPKPRFYARKAGTTALVKDGHTLVLGLQEVARFEKEVGVWREVRNGEVQRTLLVMLTPVMIDPAGNRINP